MCCGRPFEKEIIFGNLFKTPKASFRIHLRRDHMRTYIRLCGILLLLYGFLFLISGCTEQNNLSPPETLQAILQKGITIESVSYDLEISTIINGSVEQSTLLRVWQHLPFLREDANTTAGNMTIPLTIIKRPEGVYRYDPVLQYFVPDPQVIIPQPSIAEMATDILNNQTIFIIGSENISGRQTTVFSFSPNGTGDSITMKLWFWNEKGVPLKAVQITQNEYQTVTTEYLYTNYSFEMISESVFSVE
jgi:outer membrane lipoprotein-sorting protein